MGALALAHVASGQEAVGITKVRELLENFQETAIKEGKEAAALQEEKSCTCIPVSTARHPAVLLYRWVNRSSRTRGSRFLQNSIFWEKTTDNIGHFFCGRI